MRVAIVGQPGFIHDSYKMNIDNLLGSVGFNTGNLVYMHAITQHIQSEKRFFGWGIKPDLINKNFNLMVFAAANQLNPDKDLPNLAKLFEAVTIPIVIIGLGVQAKNDSRRLNFKKGTLRFIDVIKEKCSHVSVRGDYTASVLIDHGAKNVIATGCPSNFINFDADLGNKITLKNERIKSIVINNNIRKNMYSFLSNIIINNEFEQIKLIMQDNKSILDFCRKKINSDYYAEAIEIIQDRMLKDYDFEYVEKFALENIEAFYNVEAWMEYLQRFSASIGSRMHGNMLALQVGVPTVFLPHDARLQELVDIMKLPFVSFSEAAKLNRIEEIIPLVNFDPEKYNQNRRLLAKKFCNIYESQGIRINNGLKSLGSSA